jgi:hypothetical protein
MKYPFIKENQTRRSVELLCEGLEVSRSGYYSWLTRAESKRARENHQLKKAIRKALNPAGKRIVIGASIVHYRLRKKCVVNIALLV